jgi:tellurite resistance protein TehA-like permease
MGAVAISVVAGTSLSAAAPQSQLVQQLLPFVNGLTLMFWATATWWIPMLLILGYWRHVLRRFPLTYSPLSWGAVFPLGMYSVATHRLANVAEVPFLLFLPRMFLFIALAAWAVTFVGLIRAMSPAERAPGA